MNDKTDNTVHKPISDALSVHNLHPASSEEIEAVALVLEPLLDVIKPTQLYSEYNIAQAAIDAFLERRRG